MSNCGFPTREAYRAYHREYAKRRRRENPEARAKERLRNQARRLDPIYLETARIRSVKWRRGEHASPRELLCVLCNASFIAQGRQKYCHDCADDCMRKRWGEVYERIRNNPDRWQHKLRKSRERFHRRRLDPVIKARMNKYSRDHHRQKMKTNLAYRARVALWRRLRHSQRWRSDPKYRARAIEAAHKRHIQRRLLKNPEPLIRAVLAQLVELGFPTSLLKGVRT